MANSKKMRLAATCRPPNGPNARLVPFLSGRFSSVSPEEASTLTESLVSSQIHPAERPYSPATEEENPVGKS